MAVLDIGVVCKVKAAELLIGCRRIHPAVGINKMDAILQQGIGGASRTRPLAIGVTAATAAYAAFTATFRTR